MSIIPISFYQHVSNPTNKYAYKDCLVEKTATDLYGNLKTKNYPFHGSGWIDGVETTGRRHIADNEYIMFQATPRYVLCWIAILILSGGQVGSAKKEPRKSWHKPHHGI